MLGRDHAQAGVEALHRRLTDLPVAAGFDRELDVLVLVDAEDVAGRGLLDPCSEDGGAFVVVEVDSAVVIARRLAWEAVRACDIAFHPGVGIEPVAGVVGVARLRHRVSLRLSLPRRPAAQRLTNAGSMRRGSEAALQLLDALRRA
ncbi:hypothetical protein D3230_04395 [Leucobacter chromiireducens subsp. solipictus]|uniref:Uncharacterized protein n=1 Tax=Leucobacter chromiireducens subsp. solipictus TaxID=398235 RepID=A0ABS1SDA7_9MICO|nr:hypothetical protein [Leucobacter chromiireducens subsp. solipictus]